MKYPISIKVYTKSIEILLKLVLVGGLSQHDKYFDQLNSLSHFLNIAKKQLIQS